ncbi:unnamed protein product [Leuciscus chuanchicus]
MKRKLKRGDLIEIFRGPYQHWAVYVGNGDVIHLASDSGRANAGSCCVGSVGQDKATVKREKLEDVVGNNKYRISNRLDDQRKPRPIKEILKEALSHLGEMIPYNVIKNNCEHFVTLLRYGEPESLQAEAVEAVVDAFSFSTIIGAMAVVGFTVIREILKNK